MIRALLIGKEPSFLEGFTYVGEGPFDAVVIGSLDFGQLLKFREERVLAALAQGLPVYLYVPGLPQSPGNRPLSASLTAAQRELKSWGIRFTDGGQKRLITAREAQQLRLLGKQPQPGAVLTPLAREIMEGTQ